MLSPVFVLIVVVLALRWRRRLAAVHVSRALLSRLECPLFRGPVLRSVYGLWDPGQPPAEAFHRMHFNASQLCASRFVIHDRHDVENAIVSVSTLPGLEKLPDIYFSCQRNIAKADIGRYALILDQGGVYCDLDVLCLHGGEFAHPETWKRNGVWWVEHEAMLWQLDRREDRTTKRLANFIFGARAGAPVLLQILCEVCRRCSGLRNKTNWSDADVLYATGPDVVTTLVSRCDQADLATTAEVHHLADGTWRNNSDVTA